MGETGYMFSRLSFCKDMLEGIEELLRTGRWADALLVAEGVANQQPLNAKAHGYIGLCHFRLGQFEQAVEPLRKALTLDEHYWEAGTKLAQALDRLQRYEEALEVVEKCLKDRPSDPTLVHLQSGLKRNVPERITDSWQKSVVLDWHRVELTHRD